MEKMRLTASSGISDFCSRNSFTEDAFFNAVSAYSKKCFFSSEDEGPEAAAEDILSYIGYFDGRKGDGSPETRVEKDDQGYSLECICDPEALSEYLIKGFSKLFDHIASEFTVKEKLKDVTLTDKEDEEKILAIYDTDIDAAYRPGYRILQDAADRYPDRKAVIAVDRTLTYRELNEEANAIGHVLRDDGVGPNTIVAVFADRDSYAHVMRNGVLKSGGAFLPIDPEYPDDRIRMIMEDSGCRRILTTSGVMDRRGALINGFISRGVSVFIAEQALEKGSRENIDADVPGNALAYVIYTSGSTGRPKGVMLENHNLSNFANDNEKNLEALSFLDWGDTSISIAPLTFDVSILEQFVPYLRGMTNVFATMEQFMDADAMCSLIVDNNVTVMTCTPTYLLNMIEIEAFRPAVRNLRSADVGAEAFPAALYEKLVELNPDLYIVNTYGPTECTVTCTLKVMENSKDITIGKPLANARMATLDREGRLQPLGALGELVIMGEGVGRGYIGRDDLNAKNFIRLLGRPAYRSGDLARIREDGEIDFHGRMDDQVKLRGLRVELGEIQSVMSTYPGISASTVIVEKGDTDFLAAYFTADRQIEIRKLRDHLASSLTAYMVPQAFMQLEEMPLTPNGKVDRKALPKLTIEADEIVPPENETQEAILKDASEVIGGVQLGITTDLYAAGMSSIGCIRLCALLSERFNRSIKVAEIFEHRTVKDIESLISEKEEDAGYELLEEYPLSMTQQGIYIECEKYKGTTIYNLPELYELDPVVDTARLAEAVTKVIKAHPYLMMQPVKAAEGELHAKRRDDLGFEVKRVKCAHLPGEDELVRPFDLELEEPLFRAEIYETDEGNYFFFDTHHIVSDGGSIDILIRDIERAYQGEEVPKETYTAYEFALDEQKARSSDRFTKARAFYDGIFEGCGGETVPVKDGSEGAGHSAFKHVTGAGIAARVQRFCEDNSLSLNAFYTAVFGLALKSYTGSEQAVFSAIYNGRNDVRLADSVSMLVKTLPVYLACDPDESVKSYIEGCQRFLLSAMANDIYSFAEIRSAYDIRADVLFAFQGEYEHEVKLGGKPAKAGMLSLSQTRSELGIDVFTDGDHIVYEVEYDPSSYSEYTVDGILRMMDRIACEFTGKGMLEDVTLISEDEAAAIDELYDSSFPVRERPAYRLLQDSAVKYPDRKALVATDRTLTYRELNEEANALGNVLINNGAGPESIVAVMAERNSYAYVMRQGVLKSGGAFLPIDPEYPEDRIRFILEDSGAKILVTTAKTAGDRADLLNDLSAGGLRVIRAEEAVAEGSREDPDAEVPYEALAYVIYTSGSTGRPKGVMLTNKNLVNFVDDDEKNREIQGYTRRGHVSLAIAALTFDFSIMEEFVPIANGLTVVLATQEEIMNPEMLSAVMKENDVDIMSCTPSYLLNMLDMSECTDVFTDAVKNLRSVDVGAEAFPPALYDKLKAVNPDIYIMNGYGPTETTIGCTMQVIENGNDITIGVPSVNVSVATIDREGRLQPLGALGEMVIIGDGVGRGYIGRDDLTKESFISLLGKKAYRSGDLVRIREDRNIEFHGRIDNQVKLRGLRVELGEIESVINSYPGVSSCIVIVVRQETEYLAAYFTAKEETDINSLKEHVSAKLTAYMVPQVFMQLETMPLTANGKIDRKKLPKPAAKQEDVVSAENDTQKGILEDVGKVLGRAVTGITTDLFTVGLSSIGCIKLCAFLSGRFKKSVKVSEIFENRTVRDIEKLISGKEGDTSHEVLKDYPLSMTQTGIYIECERNRGTTVYNIPSLFRLDPSVDTDKLAEAVRKVVKAHPYLLMRPVKNDEGDLRSERRDDFEFEVKKISCPHLPGEDELVRPFDLEAEEPLFRAEIYETEDGNYFFLDTHHLVSDGNSLDILMRDIDRACEGEEIRKESYTGYDFALDEEKARSGDRLKKAMDWYDSVFAGCQGETMPVKDGREGAGHMGFRTVTGSADAGRVVRFCDEHGLTLNAFFTAAFGLALKAYTAGENAIFCTIYNGRSDSRLSDSVSMLVKTLPVYLECSPESTVKDFIEGCAGYLLSAMANDIYSFAEIRSAYDIKADILFSFQGEYEHDANIGGKPAELKLLDLSDAKSAIGVDVFTDGNRIVYEIEHDPSEYSDYTVNGLVGVMDRIITEFTVKEKLKDVTLVSDVDKKLIDGLYDSYYPVEERPAYRLLQDSASRYPERTAVVATDRTLTYRELNEEANALGNVLINNGAGPEEIVAVMAERDSFAYVMRQGILKSGGAFLPIDPEYPEDRIRYILEDSGAKILVTTAKVLKDRADLFGELSVMGINVIEAGNAVARGGREDINADVPYDALAYVIYTSGSTGRPKGVMLTNKNLVNFVDDDEKNGEIQGYTKRGHVSLAIAALTFDFSIMEEFVPIANGMTVVLATQEEIMNPIMLSALMKMNKVDVMSCTPSYLLNMLDMSAYTDVFTDAVKNLRSVDMGAEAFPPALYDKLKAVNPDIYIMNGYGPTEATISCTMQVIENVNDITIGVPNVNVSVATIDREGRLQPLGALGEMVIIGDGVGRGYIGRDDLTKKSFISLFGKKAYRSGDLVRIREDRNIEFHGRIDNQVKLRGLRVELGEIESVINSYPGVSSCIVIVVKQETEYLAAYFTAKEETDINSLKEHISAKLTAYMVPQVFMQLESMPLTANGKIDKKKLPKPVAKQEEIAPPENDIQREILEELEKVLGNKMIGITTDLFEAGLSSIGSIKLCTLLSQRFDRTIRVSDLFERKTVKDIEKFISGGAEEQTYEVRKEYPLTMSQMGIFLESIRYMGTTVYNIPYLYRLDASVDMEKLKTALQEVFATHPGLFMTMKSEDNKAVAVRNDVRTIGIEIQKEMPDREELVRPFDLLSGQELYRVGLYDTAEGKYLFIDLHHIISDGESFNILFEDLDAAYNGQKLQAEEYTGFDAALVEEAERASDKFTRAKEWYDRIFRGTEGVVLPEREEISSGENEGLYTRISGIGAKEVRKYCEEKELSLNAFFTALFGVSLKAYTGSEDAVFTTIYNGRSDPRTERCISMFVKTLPILLKPYPEQRISEYIGNCGKYLINAMANDIVSFAEISREYGIESDILFAYQGEAEENESVKIGAGPAEEIELSLSQAKAPFGLDIYIDGDSIKYEFEYDPEMYTTHTMDRFTSMMDAVLGRFLAADKLLDVYDCDAVRELSGERKKTEKAAAENGGTAGEGPAAGALVEELRGIFKKVLGLDNVNDNDNFFEIGGTSLTAAQVMMAAMSQDLPVLYKDVFEHPTISALASLVEEKHKAIFGTGAAGTVKAPDKEPVEEKGKDEDKGTGAAEVPGSDRSGTDLEKALSHNNVSDLEGMRPEGLGNVLLTGATGFLGMHVFHELLTAGTGRIFCLMHKSGRSGETLLKQTYFYYFGTNYESKYDERVTVLAGDITDPESLRDVFVYDFNTVINCAACVKHFADLDVLKNVNTLGVMNLAKCCLEKKVRLVHTSTVSVAGDSVGPNAEKRIMTERDFDFGQEVESNGYVYTKFLAEKYLLESIEKDGLDAKIMRLGNLMSRFSDGEFQINFNTNNFMNTIKAYVALGCFPVNQMADVDEFSPIDEVARAIVLLSGTPKEFTAFNVYNSHSVELGDIIFTLKDMGYRIDITEDREFETRLRSMTEDEEKNIVVSPLFNYNLDDDDARVENDSDNTFTMMALYRLGFRWSITDEDYIKNSMRMLDELSFFD